MLKSSAWILKMNILGLMWIYYTEGPNSW